MASYRDLAGALEALARYHRTQAPQSGSVLLSHCEQLIAEARRGQTTETPWTPFERASSPVPSDLIKRAAERLGIPADAAVAEITAQIAAAETFTNSRYQVQRMSWTEGMVYLTIKRIDQTPIRSWRDLQRIKSELVGEACEGVELFPAESRLVDTANQYHLFVLVDPTARFPFGHDGGRHQLEDIGAGEGQEPLEPL